MVMETKTLKVKISEDGTYANTYRVRVEGWMVLLKKWKLISNARVKGRKSAEKVAAEHIKAAQEHETLLESYGKDPLTYA